VRLSGCRACRSDEGSQAHPVTVLLCDRTVVPSGASSSQLGSLMAALFTRNRQARRDINTEPVGSLQLRGRNNSSASTLALAPGDAPQPLTPQSPGVEPQLLKRLGFILLRAAADAMRCFSGVVTVDRATRGVMRQTMFSD